MRAGRIHQGRENTAGRKGARSRCDRNHFRIAGGHLYRDQLHRECRRHRRRRPHRTQQRFRRGTLLLAMFCSPLAAAIPGYATAPALILVGALMTQSIAHIDWADFSEAVPAFITMLATPLTFSIATGLSLGLISYTVVKIAVGKIREINLLIWILTVLFILRYIYLATA